jgi:hypothetical protein
MYRAGNLPEDHIDHQEQGIFEDAEGPGRLTGTT